MLTTDLINNTIPRLQLKETVSTALRLMSDLRITHLPVVSEEKYLGLISEDVLLDVAEEETPVELLQESFLQRAVVYNEHFLSAVNFTSRFDTNVVPVVNEELELTGSILGEDLLKVLSNFCGANSIGSIIVLEMERSQFSISEISRIIESNDDTILNLNTVINPTTGILTVTLQLSKNEVSVIVASFERYQYNVIAYFGNEKFENKIDSNFRHLMNYLDI
jgi:acetoin utilization protein AcuB